MVILQPYNGLNRYIRLLSLSLIMTCLGSVLGFHFSETAHAALPCAKSNSNFHTGYQKSLSNILGVKATVEVNNPDLCDASATNPSALSASTSWVMIVDATRTRYIQAGWLKFEGSSVIRHFVQYNPTGKAGDHVTFTYGSASPGIAYTYSVNYQSSCVNSSGTNVGACWTWTNASPDQYVLASKFPSGIPVAVQYYAETLDTSDQTPGGKANPTDFTNVLYRDSTAWKSPVLTAGNGTSTHPRGIAIVDPSGTKFQVYDSNY
jgi:hypothetical protein